MTLKQELQVARDQAHTISAEKGIHSPESAVAWDIVEELQAEAAHQKASHPKTSLEEYCDDNPDALEARMYDD